MAAPAAEAAPAHPGFVPAAVAATAPATVAVPSSMPTSAPGPVGRTRWPAVKADELAGKTAPAEMRYRRRRSHSREAAGDIPAMPPGGSDRREGQNRRTDKEREGRRREDDEGRCHCNSDGRRRQDYNWRGQRRTEQHAGRWRRRGRCHGWSSHRRRWGCRNRRGGDRGKSDDDRWRRNVDRRWRDDQRRSNDYAEGRTRQQTAPCPGAWAPSPTEIAPAPGMVPIPPASPRTDKPWPAPAVPKVGRGEASSPAGFARTMLVPAEMSAVVVPAPAAEPASSFVPTAALPIAAPRPAATVPATTTVTTSPAVTVAITMARLDRTGTDNQ